MKILNQVCPQRCHASASAVMALALLAASTTAQAQTARQEQHVSLRYFGSATAALFSREIDASFAGAREKDFVPVVMDAYPAGFVNPSAQGLGATAVSDGNFRYAVYVAQDGKRGTALMNLEQARPINVQAVLPNAGSLLVATPEDQDAKPAGNTVTVPARSAAIPMNRRRSAAGRSTSKRHPSFCATLLGHPEEPCPR